MSDSTAVLTNQHEHCTEHHLATIFSSGASTQFLPQVYFSDITHAYGRAVDVSDHYIGDIIQVLYLARCAHQQLLATTLDVTGANVSVVALQSCDQISQCQTVGRKAAGVGRHLELLGKATDGIDLGDTRHVAQLRFDHPVLDHPQVGRRVLTAVLLARALLGLNGPQEYLPEARRDRPHGRLNAFGQLLTGLL